MSEHDYKATGYDTINLFRKQIKKAQPEFSLIEHFGERSSRID